MSKKVISVLLSAAMLVGTLCVGVGAVTASAADGEETYYFLAPDNYFKTEAGAVNEDVGVWYFGGSAATPDGYAWPGLKAEKAPEIGENVFKTTIPAGAVNIIFNAYVDAGTPINEELAKVAHQTADINLEGYDAGENALYPDGVESFDGYIYVLGNDADHQAINEFSGAITTSGEWFTTDPADANYYKNSDLYKTYNFSDSAATDVAADSDVATDATTDSEVAADSDVASTKKYHEGDTVTITYLLGNIDRVGALGALITFDNDYLEFVESEEPDVKKASIVVNDGEGTFKIGANFEPKGKTSDFAGEKTPLTTITYTAKKDFNVEDLNVVVATSKLVQVSEDGKSTTTIISSADQDSSAYVDYKVNVDCKHATDTATDTTTDTTTDTATDTTTDTATDTSTSTATDTSSASDTNSASDSTRTPDTASTNSTNSNGSSSNNNNNSSNNNGTATVQTAGTFAVISLVVILMAAAAVVLYTRKKTEE